MGLFNSKRTTWTQQLANVDTWLPSKRPIYRNRKTGQLYRLDKVEDSQVVLSRTNCGRQIRESFPSFEAKYLRV